MLMAMEGMAILEQMPVMEMTGLGFIIFECGILLGIAGLMSYNKLGLKALGIVFTGLCLAVSTQILQNVPYLYIKTGNEYKCTFDSNTTINQIEEKFDVLSVEDGVWTIRDKSIGE